jgi:hypothetical protein
MALATRDPAARGSFGHRRGGEPMMLVRRLSPGKVGLPGESDERKGCSGEAGGGGDEPQRPVDLSYGVFPVRHEQQTADKVAGERDAGESPVLVDREVEQKGGVSARKSGH